MTSVNDIRAEINKLLADYADGVGEKVEKSAKKVAKEAAKMLVDSSPIQNVRTGGDYTLGWRAKKVGTAWVVHNKTDYQLTHLLEKGHAKVNGGRVAPRVHIKPVEQKSINDFIQDVEGAIKG